MPVCQSSSSQGVEREFSNRSIYTNVGGKKQVEPGQHPEMTMMTAMITEEQPVSPKAREIKEKALSESKNHFQSLGGGPCEEART